MGAQGVLVLPPYYCKPNQEEIFYHFVSIADAVDIPIMLYNNPFTTGVDIQPETVKKMTDYHSNLCYIKECTGDIKRIRQLQLLCGDKIKIFCGWEIYKSMLPMLQFLEYRGKAPQTIKYCLERIGLCGGTSRLPRLPLSDEDKRDIDKMLKELKLM